MSSAPCVRRLSLLTAIIASALLFSGSAANGQAADPKEEAARAAILSANQALNEKNYPVALQRYTDFIEKHPEHAEVATARYGLGVCCVEGVPRDYEKALEQLKKVADVKDFKQRPYALHYLGMAHRGMSKVFRERATANPAEAEALRKKADEEIESATVRFAAAIQTVEAAMKADPNAPLLKEWAERGRCDLAEILVRLGKNKEARIAVDPVLKQLKEKPKSRTAITATYLDGLAAFNLKDYRVAGRTLSRLSPFDDPIHGLHTRYLLARIHHLADERPEAMGHYESILKDFDDQKKAAPKQLKTPEVQKDPDEKARLEALAKGPAAEFLARTAFQLAVMYYEDGRYGSAGELFGTFPQRYPNSPLVAETPLRLGMCQVHSREFAKAIQTLTPLEERQPKTADQSLYWLGRAQLGMTVGNPPPKNAERWFKTGTDTLRKAADRAKELLDTDPEAKVRRADILMEWADAHFAFKQYKEAAAVYGDLLKENGNPARSEDALLKQAVAFQLAGLYKQSDDICRSFLEAYPRSPQLPDALFRTAENAYLTAVAAANKPELPNKEETIKPLFEEAIKRYTKVVSKYPEFGQINLARFGLAQSHHRLGEWEKTVKVLATIPASDRSGELAAVSYLHADCILRQLPAAAKDALAAARLNEQLAQAIKHLDSFIAADPAGANTPDAILKLGYCRQRTAMLLANPKERFPAWQAARATYDKFQPHFAQHPLAATATFERAKCAIGLGDVGAAVAELTQFQNDPLKTSAIAPQALLRLAGLHRLMKKNADFLKTMELCRGYEADLLKDPARADWVPTLQFHHAQALLDNGKPADARTLLESTIKTFPAHADGRNAVWLLGQVQREEAVAKLKAADGQLAKPMATPDEVAAANTSIKDAVGLLDNTAKNLLAEAEKLAKNEAGTEPQLRMIYEAAWCQRVVMQRELDAARMKLAKEIQSKLLAERVKRTPINFVVLPVPLPEIAVKAVPVSPAEQKCRDIYKALITAGPDTPLSLEAHLEWAELLAMRDDHAAAIKLLNEAIELEPTGEVLDRLRLQLGICQLANKNAKAGLATFDAILKNARSPLAVEARHRAADCLIDMNDPAKAVQYLTPYRDQGPLQNIAGVSDRALLRLGHAFALQKDWPASQQACELLIQRFPKSPWLHEARHGVGWALQNQKKWDEAVTAYQQVVQNCLNEWAAHAQLQIGCCRLEQKRTDDAINALLNVPLYYDYPDLSAFALMEASRACLDAKRTDHAAKLLEKVIKDHPKSQWAEAARKKLEEMK